MAKRKQSIDLSQMDIFFKHNEEEYKAERFYPSQMSVDITRYIDGKKDQRSNIAFAHLPKSVKRIIKPK